MLNCRRYALIGLGLILLAQTLLMGYFGYRKVGFHLDEIYTFELANFPQFTLAHSKNFVDRWHKPEVFQSAVTVRPQQRFNYSIPYHNQARDSHPPLYYWIIHTVSSLFPGKFSKWMGIVPNMLFNLITTTLLFFVAKRLIRVPMIALLVAAMWGLSIGAMSSAVFIRMYAQLTMFCVALLWAHLSVAEKMVQKELKYLNISTLALVFMSSLGGILTQYYFLIFNTLLSSCFSLWMAGHRKWRVLLQYLGVELSALGSAVLIFPAMMVSILKSSRGQQAFADFAGLNLAGGKHAWLMLNIINQQLTNGWLLTWLVVIVLSGIGWCLFDLFRGSGLKLSHKKAVGTVQETGVRQLVTFLPQDGLFD